jgi:haloacetate dehalogenase
MLLHGFSQTHVQWHLVAPQLADKFTLIIADLPGYGWSDMPESDKDHTPYTKRAMARTIVEAMERLGHVHFALAGHDRGGRVAYRLALDHPEVVSALIPIDILPTAEVWARLRADSAIKSYHWGFLAQPRPMPETLISNDPVFYLEHTLKSWAKPRDLSPFSAEALAHYRALMSDPRRVHAMCEDYRAGATIDRRLDEADLAAGRKITSPTLVLWGSDYLGRGAAPPLEVWHRWCTDVTGVEIDSGHFLADENPTATLAALVSFLGRLEGKQQ